MNDICLSFEQFEDAVKNGSDEQLKALCEWEYIQNRPERGAVVAEELERRGYSVVAVEE